KSLRGYNQSLAGTFGKLYVNTATGAYTFVPDDTAINALSSTTAENFTFTVSDGSLSAQQNFTVTLNGTPEATVSISNGTPNPATEGTDATMSFTVTLSTALNVDTVVTYSTVNGSAVAGADFTSATNATITIPAGFTTGTISIPVLNDTIVEGTEQFSVMLSSAQNVGSTGSLVITNTTGTATIIDNDTATWTITGSPSVTEAAGASHTASYTVNLGGTLQSGENASIVLSLSNATTDPTGLDLANEAQFDTAVQNAVTAYNVSGPGSLSYNSTSDTLTFTSDGSAMGNLVINLTAVDDTLVEGPETFSVSLASPSSTTGSAIALGAS